MPDAIVSDLGRRLFVQVDPAWPYINDFVGNTPAASTKLSAMFMDLDNGITESAMVQYADINLLGRAEPVKVWVGNGPREVTLVFKFRAQGGNVDFSRVGGSGTGGFGSDPAAAAQTNQDGVQQRDSLDERVQDALRQEVQWPARFLDMLRYPFIDYNGIMHSPPPVYLSIGRLLRMRAVVSACSITWLPPFDPDTMLPHGADVTVSFCSVTTKIGNYSSFGPTRIQPPGLVQGLDTIDGG